jgi:hypothetical protein
LLEVSLCEEALDRGARVHGFAIDDIRERMRARQRMIERLAMVLLTRRRPR